LLRSGRTHAEKPHGARILPQPGCAGRGGECRA
jgi:hypothetical protein